VELDRRKRQVLRAIVEDYVASAEPIGSRTLARTLGLGVSSATIRNEMADLEALGLLDKPHTSAGRVPSDRGYRLYVDELMQPGRLDLEEEALRRMRLLYLRRVREVDYLVGETLRLLSAAGDFLAVGLGPGPRHARLRRLDALEAGEGQIALVLVTDHFVQHRLIEMPDGMDAQGLQRALRALSQELQGMGLERLTRPMIEAVAREIKGRLRDELLAFLQDCLADGDERVRIAGTSSFLAQPEFREPGRIREAVRLIEESAALQELLREASDAGGVCVRIGEETSLAETRELSIVAIGVERQGELVARFGLVGPKRMDYRKALALAEEVLKGLEQAIN
jgi:heat-inducible transcriptional repressor